MFTEHRVMGLLPLQLRSYTNYLTKVINLFVNADSDCEGTLEMMVFPNIGSDLRVGLPQGWDKNFPEYLSKLFIKECGDWSSLNSVCAEAKQVPLPLFEPYVESVPVLPEPIDYVTRHASDIAKLKRLRYEQKSIRGQLLVSAAAEMEGWFKWVASGAKDPQKDKQIGHDYGIKMAKTNSMGQVTKRNDFAIWLMNRGEEPQRQSCMNCWEAVLYSAYRAGLVDKAVLQTHHKKAALAYEIGDKFGDGGGTSYLRALAHMFNTSDSVPYEPKAGLTPICGDVLFWEGLEHVALSLGPHWQSGDQMMLSLWHNNNGSFSILTYQDLSPLFFENKSLRFLPCPF